MSYTPTNWKSGDVVTSAKLNKMEGGIAASGPLICHENAETGALDHTWQEIHDAGFAVLLFATSETNFTVTALASIISVEDNYVVYFGESAYVTTSADGYPVFDEIPK